MSLSSSQRQLAAYTLVTVIIGFVIGNLIFGLLSIDFSASDQPVIDDSISSQRLRIGLFINHICTFAIPGLVALYLCYKKQWWSTVSPAPFPGKSLGWVILFTVVALPLVGVSMWVNLQIPLPEWAMQTEAETAALLEKVLKFDGPLDLFTALLAIGVAAGLGEEIIFRGILQGRVLSGLNHHLAIWIAAMIFSLIHLELAGFLPRMLLGAILGYAFHWSGSLLVPILIHMVFNGLQVVAAYISGEFTPDTAPVELPAWYVIVLSAIATIGIAYYLEAQWKQSSEQYPKV